MNLFNRYALTSVLALALCSFLIGCGGSTTSENTAPKNDNKTAETKPAETKPAETTTASTSGDKIGVAECDEYLDKYEACISGKVPEAARATLKSSLETTRKEWKKAASTPEGRAGLANACKTARDAAKQSMSAYGCSW